MDMVFRNQIKAACGLAGCRLSNSRASQVDARRAPWWRMGLLWGLRCSLSRRLQRPIAECPAFAGGC